MPQPPENDTGLTAPRPEVFLGDLNLGVYKRVWWPIPVAMRPLAGPAGTGALNATCENWPSFVRHQSAVTNLEALISKL